MRLLSKLSLIKIQPRAEVIRSPQERLSVQTRRQSIQILPGWLRANLFEQLKDTTFDNLCISARKQLSIHNICKTDNSMVDAFSEMGPSITVLLGTTLTKLSTCQKTMDNRERESKKL